MKEDSLHLMKYKSRGYGFIVGIFLMVGFFTIIPYVGKLVSPKKNQFQTHDNSISLLRLLVMKSFLF